MNRRVRTSVLELNGHGHYVGYVVDKTGSYLVIFAGPSEGWWKF